ncbi:MAG: hypothetical protein GY873_08815 [Bosea sp.]|uniref:hypothetical protein n=1 Tax=Bosea sp. (in: a-proteobacteria) TaxID=1871050 RepID=UPI00238C671C|nr:hypothetical protein [Bosea sp. (in: a-proteobacteria)]MCP4734280.1 hypothetical protein [Bosea sp. (in: a-proteobacteria)]
MDRISHSTAVDIGGGRMGFRSKDTVGGVPGTVVTATHMNATQEEMLAVIEEAGDDPDPNDLKQLVKVMRGGRLNWRTAGGTANALTIALAPQLLAYVAGLPLTILTGGNANTGAMTLNIDGLGAKAIVKRSGAAMAAGDVPAGSLLKLAYDGVAFRMIGLVASDIAARKTAFNVTQTVFTARASLSGTGMVTYQTGIYTKKSATSQLIVEVSTNAFSLSGTAAAFGRISGLPINMEWIVRNGDTGTSSPASTGSKIYTGLAAGAVNWTWSFGRNDAGAWSSIINPRSPTDAAFLPVETTSFITFSELEP